MDSRSETNVPPSRWTHDLKQTELFCVIVHDSEIESSEECGESESLLV
jgi:hypothetical protein